MNPGAICRQAPGIVSAAVPADDSEGCAAQIDLPCPLVTEAAPLPAVTVDALRLASDNLARGVTDPERVARAAEAALPVRIEGRHPTHLIADGGHVIRPRAAGQALVRRGDRRPFPEAPCPIRADRRPAAGSELFAHATCPVAGARRMAGTAQTPDAGLMPTVTDRRARVLRAAGGSIAADDEG